MSKSFLPDLCLWSWGRQARQGRLSVAQSGATITSASPDNHLTGCVHDPNFQAKNWSSDRGRSSRHSIWGPPRPFLCQAGRGGYIISLWKGIEAVQILRTKYFFKAEMHTHCTRTNIKTTQREL